MLHQRLPEGAGELCAPDGDNGVLYTLTRQPMLNEGGSVSGGMAPTVITATVRIIREVSATAVKALPVRP